MEAVRLVPQEEALPSDEAVGELGSSTEVRVEQAVLESSPAGQSESPVFVSPRIR
jgi:hypothetical protein